MSQVLSAVGYYLAALLVVTMPGALLYWYLIHGAPGFWRRLGKVWTFVIVGAICIAFVVALWPLRHWYMAVHWGYRWPLIAVGLVLYGVGAWLDFRIRRQLVWGILVGTPEIDAEAPGKLITDGIYARSRNPRYVNIIVALTGIALILNYPAVYAVTLLMVPGLYLVVLLEERELRGRFGEEYDEYCRQVPRFLPRRG